MAVADKVVSDRLLGWPPQAPLSEQWRTQRVGGGPWRRTFVLLPHLLVSLDEVLLVGRRAGRQQGSHAGWRERRWGAERRDSLQPGRCTAPAAPRTA